MQLHQVKDRRPAKHARLHARRCILEALRMASQPGERLTVLAAAGHQAPPGPNWIAMAYLTQHIRASSPASWRANYVSILSTISLRALADEGIVELKTVTKSNGRSVCQWVKLVNDPGEQPSPPGPAKLCGKCWPKTSPKRCPCCGEPL